MTLSNTAIASGRVVTGLFFALAALNKVMNFDLTANSMEAEGLPGALLPLVIGLELVGGLVVMIGRGRRLFIMTSLALAVFTLATNIFFHKFWALDGNMQTVELSLFFKNLVIAGALVSFAGLKAQSTRPE